MKITVLEPYFTGSHRAWAQGYASHASHDVEILTMPGRFWKWRMHGGAVFLAEEFKRKKSRPDLILASSMLDLSSFLALTRGLTADIPAAIYFHENQFAYPWQEGDRDRQKGRDIHYGFINFISALSADHVFFNSSYNMQSFLKGTSRMLRHFPDYNIMESLKRIEDKSSTLHLGLNLSDLHISKKERSDCDLSGKKDEIPVIVWNHRWEYDKNPAAFFNALFRMADRDIDFRLILLGENFRQKPLEFLEAESKLASRIIHSGYAKSRNEYARLLRQANLLPVTSFHDFFGTSVCEAIYCGCLPILPRRVAYPELIPEELHSEIFYERDEEFYERLVTAVTEWSDKKERREEILKRLCPHIEKFSWENMAPLYDKRLEEIASRRAFDINKKRRGQLTAPLQKI